MGAGACFSSILYTLQLLPLADKGRLTKLESDPSEYKYELSPKGERFLNSKRKTLERRNYKGSYDDVVQRELEPEFHGGQHTRQNGVGRFGSGVSDIPCQREPLRCVVYGAYSGGLDATVGTNVILELDVRKESLYLSALGKDGKSFYRVVYRLKERMGGLMSDKVVQFVTLEMRAKKLKKLWK